MFKEHRLYVQYLSLMALTSSHTRVIDMLSFSAVDAQDMLMSS